MQHASFDAIGCRCWIGVGIGKFLDRHAPHMEAACNFGETHPLQIQLSNRFIALHPLAARLFTTRFTLWTRDGDRDRPRGGSSASHHDLLEGLPMAMKDAFHGLREVL